MPQVFSDAAPFHSSFVVACSRSLCFATCSPTPSWVRSIQDAELYGIFHTLRQCSLQKLSHVCPLTDNMGVYYTVSSGRVSSACPARILRRIFRVCLQFQLCFQIAWVPSARNAADFFSRPLTCSPLCLSRAIHRLSPSSSTLPVSTASSVWFRPPPLFGSLRHQTRKPLQCVVAFVLLFANRGFHRKVQLNTVMASSTEIEYLPQTPPVNNKYLLSFCREREREKRNANLK